MDDRQYAPRGYEIQNKHFTVCSSCGNIRGSFHAYDCGYVEDAEFTMIITDSKPVSSQDNITTQGDTYKTGVARSDLINEAMRFYVRRG